MNSFLKILTLLVVAVMTTFAGGGAMAYEEPRYDIVHKADGYEVRKYYDRVAAQVTKASSSNKAFRTLFGYISGANQTSEKVSMTIPVTQSEKIAMTVPVTQGDSGYMRFFLPASYTLETAPKPTNPDVDVVVVKGGYYAVYSYSGRANDKNFFEARTVLLGRLNKDGVVTASEVIRATYNGPFTLPFNRRNEALVRIEWP
jgi:DNA gyrase inhibitor GyrI